MVILPEELLYQEIGSRRIYCWKEKTFAEIVNAILIKGKRICCVKGLEGRKIKEFKGLTIVGKGTGIKAGLVLSSHCDNPILSKEDIIDKVPESPRLVIDFNFWNLMKENMH